MQNSNRDLFNIKTDEWERQPPDGKINSRQSMINTPGRSCHATIGKRSCDSPSEIISYSPLIAFDAAGSHAGKVERLSEDYFPEWFRTVGNAVPGVPRLPLNRGTAQRPFPTERLSMTLIDSPSRTNFDLDDILFVIFAPFCGNSDRLLTLSR